MTQKEQLKDERKRREFWIVGPNYCTDEETRAYTRNGWKRYNELVVGEEVYSLNTITGFGEWQAITAVNVFRGGPYPMMRMKQRGLDALTTLDHKWPVAWYGNRSASGRVWRERRGIRWAQTGVEASVNEMLLSSAPLNEFKERVYCDALVELVAWYSMEGHRRTPTSGVGIAQNIGENSKRIAAACIALFGAESKMITRRENTPRWRRETREGGVYLNAAAADVIAAHAPGRDKIVSLDFIHKLTRDQLQLFVLTCLQGDYLAATESIDSTCLSQKVRERLDAVQMACTLLGYKTTMKPGRLWKLYIYRRAGEMNMRSAQRNAEFVVHDGLVWCPSLPNRTWLAERNGTVYFTGNTDSEKEFRVLYNQLTRLEVPFDKPGTYNDPIGGNMHISLWDGTFQVHGKSAAHPESLVGEGLRGVIMAEAAKIKERVWVKYVRPTLNDFRGWAALTSTPEGKNWFYRFWQQGQDPRFPSWQSWRMPAWINPFVYPNGATEAGIATLRAMLNDRQAVTHADAKALGVDSEVLELMTSMTEPAFNQEIAADFTDFVGKVFKEFDEEVHVTELQFDPTWQTFAAVDYGFTNPNVWLLLQVDPFDEYINVLGEVYETGLGPDEFADEIMRKGLCPAGLKSFFPDPASPGDTNVLQRKLRVMGRPGTGGELKHRLDSIRQALRPFRKHVENDRPRILFDRAGCPNTIQDFLNYRYPDTKTEQDRNEPELPMKKDDHGPEALGRFFAGHFGTSDKERKRSGGQAQAAITRRGNVRR